MFIVKLDPDESLARLKARLVAKGYSKVCGMNYQDSSPVAKLISVRILISLVVTHHWLFHQIDVKNVFLNSVFNEEVYMK